jgi:hypothetical protein
MQISDDLYKFLEDEKLMLKDNIEDCEDRIKRNSGNKQNYQKNITLYKKLLEELNELSPTKQLNA